MTTPLLFNGILDTHATEAAKGLPQAYAAGIRAHFCKATEGKDFKDKGFLNAVQASRQLGMLVGAYHFGSNSSPGNVQADFFLKTIEPVMNPELLLVLDWETNPNEIAGTMTLANARLFVQRVKEKTGRWPIFYSYFAMLRSQILDPADIVGQCPLWMAAYGPNPLTTKPPKAWKDWSLFQYTNGGAGPGDQNLYPRSVPGIGGCDRSVFRGNYEDLKKFWLTCGK